MKSKQTKYNFFFNFRFLLEFFTDQHRPGGSIAGIPPSITVKRYDSGTKRGRSSLRVSCQSSLLSPSKSLLSNSSDAGLSPLPHGRAKCLLCDKEFSNMYNARTHIKELHSDTKPAERPLHFCHVCGATFTVARSRLNHLMRKHGISQRMMKNANYVCSQPPVMATNNDIDLESIAMKDEPEMDSTSLKDEFRLKFEMKEELN